jgi:hypothetical protein
MPSKRSSSDLVLFSTDDPEPLVRWLCDTYGMQTVLRSVAEYRPSGGTEQAPAKRAYKKRGPKKGTKRASKKGGKGGRKAGGNEAGNG